MRKVNSTSFGSSRLVTGADVAPSESVTVRVISTHEKYSWSGKTKLPLVTSSMVCSGWTWQFVGLARAQWWRSNFQEKAVAGSVPSWVSVPVPAKVTVWPTANSDPVAGEVMVAVGGVLPTSMVTRVDVLCLGRVAHSKLDGAQPSDGVGEGGVDQEPARSVAGVELPVTVEVPGVGQGVAVGVGRARAIELDGRAAPARSRGRRWPRRWAGCSLVPR